jgi:hypothetical protein
MALVAKALGDPVRLQLVDMLRKRAGKVWSASWYVIPDALEELTAWLS